MIRNITKRRYQRSKYAFRKDNHLCTVCGKELGEEYYVNCSDCRQKQREYQKIRYKRNKK